jgi:ubiquinone/menaquinone biosynthesis C-methylase UbiE
MNKESLFQQIRALFSPKLKIPVRAVSPASTIVDSYWGDHTVNSKPFKTSRASLKYLEWRFQEYPLFRELMDLWGDHSGQVVLDYGCGPGNDLTGFLVFSQAKKVIGIDVSEKALTLAGERLSLHNIDPQRVELIKISDAEPKIPLEDQSVDYIYCEGVLHHTSYPEKILGEFRRILKPNGAAYIMVYNYNSIWVHLYTAYQKMIVQNAFPDLTLLEAFARNTDGVECPISRCYKAEEFIGICEEAGFRTEFRGGYLSKVEINLLKNLGAQALEDSRLVEEHKSFLKALTYDQNGYPLFQGQYAGIGGVYLLK